MSLVDIDSIESDAALLLRLNTQDKDAMAVLFDRYSTLIYGVALRVLRCPEEAEDVTQEVLIQVWWKPPTLDAAYCSLGPLLAVMARNRAIDAVRKRRPMDSTGLALLHARTDIAAEVQQRLTVERLHKAMLNLPLNQHLLLLLAFVEGLPHPEIAMRAKIPLGTVKTRLRSALKTLRQDAS